MLLVSRFWSRDRPNGPKLVHTAPFGAVGSPSRSPGDLGKPTHTPRMCRMSSECAFWPYFPWQRQVFKREQVGRTVWPSGLRRWLKAPVRKGVGSNPTAVTLMRFQGLPPLIQRMLAVQFGDGFGVLSGSGSRRTPGSTKWPQTGSYSFS